MQQSGEKIPMMDAIEDNPSGIALPSSRSNRECFAFMLFSCDEVLSARGLLLSRQVFSIMTKLLSVSKSSIRMQVTNSLMRLSTHFLEETYRKKLN